MLILQKLNCSGWPVELSVESVLPNLRVPDEDRRYSPKPPLFTHYSDHKATLIDTTFCVIYNSYVRIYAKLLPYCSGSPHPLRPIRPAREDSILCGMPHALEFGGPCLWRSVDGLCIGTVEKNLCNLQLLMFRC